MAKESAALLVITLNVNGLNSPIKRCRLIKWVLKKTKQDPTTSYLYETYFRSEDTRRLKVQ